MGRSELSPSQLRQIVDSSATIDERLSGFKPTTSVPSAKAIARWRAWCNQSTGGDWKAFRSRFSRAQLDLLPLALDDVHSDPGLPMPEWAIHLNGVLSQLPSDVDANGDRGRDVPFFSIYKSLAEASLRLPPLSSFVITDPCLAPSITSLLTVRYADLLSRTLYQSFDLFRNIRANSGLLSSQATVGASVLYRSFVAHFMDSGGLRSWFCRLPVLARLFGAVSLLACRNVQRCVHRFYRDRAQLSSRFGIAADGRLISISRELSDPHNCGQAVLQLTTSCGHSLCYKPRSLSTDEALSSLLEWIRSDGGPDSFSIPEVLDRKKYGWALWVTHRPCADEQALERFFYRAGATLALTQLLQVTDLHHENILAVSDAPTVVDIETPLHPWLRDAYMAPLCAADALASDRLRDSVLAVGYLPNWGSGGDGQEHAVGGLNAPGDTLHRTTSFQHVNTDKMRLGSISVTLSLFGHTQELPAEEQHRQKCVDAIERGARGMYCYCLRRKTELSEIVQSDFDAITTRVLLKSTSLYDLVLKAGLGRKALADGVLWSIAIDRIESPRDASVEPRKYSAPSSKYERECLYKFNIPVFYLSPDRQCLQTGDGVWCRTLSFSDPLKQVQDRLNDLNREYIDFQCDLAANASGTLIRRVYAEPATLIPSSSCETFVDTHETAFRAFAIQIADHMLDACVDVDGRASWIVAAPLHSPRSHRFEVIGDSLYAGRSGIAVFFASLFAITQREAYLHAACQSLRPAMDALRHGAPAARVHGIAGLMSSLYAAAHIIQLVGDDAPDWMRDCVWQFKYQGNGEVDDVDIVDGAAGSIAALLSCFQATKRTHYLDMAQSLAEGICSRQRPDGGWLTTSSVPLSGFSHGAAGIALMLYRVYSLAGNDRLLRSVERALQFERKQYLTYDRRWPNLTEPDMPAFASQWCHGAAGIGLSRCALLRLGYEDPALIKEITNAAYKTVDSLVGPWCHICCGLFGRLLFLDEASRAVGHDSWKQGALAEASCFVRDASVDRILWPSGTSSFNPGFFTGMAGVGYSLLKLSTPRMCRSVHVLE